MYVRTSGGKNQSRINPLAEQAAQGGFIFGSIWLGGIIFLLRLQWFLCTEGNKLEGGKRLSRMILFLSFLETIFCYVLLKCKWSLLNVFKTRIHFSVQVPPKDMEMVCRKTQLCNVCILLHNYLVFATVIGVYALKCLDPISASSLLTYYILVYL